MDSLSKDAAGKIFRLVDENFASMRMEVSQSQKENESLRKRLQLMESESVTTQERRREGGRGGSLRIHSFWLNSDLCQTVQGGLLGSEVLCFLACPSVNKYD